MTQHSKQLIFSMAIVVAILAVGLWISMYTTTPTGIPTPTTLSGSSSISTPTTAATPAPANNTQSASTKPGSTIAIKSITRGNQTASVLDAVSQTITWQTSGYPTNTGVDINLIKKISDTPLSYSLVRQIATHISNTGSYTWIPKTNETGDDLYVEVVCANNADDTLPAGCENTAAPMQVKN